MPVIPKKMFNIIRKIQIKTKMIYHLMSKESYNKNNNNFKRRKIASFGKGIKK
jgi:hypothetical protein